eukprot:g462.t1
MGGRSESRRRGRNTRDQDRNRTKRNEAARHRREPDRSLSRSRSDRSRSRGRDRNTRRHARHQQEPLNKAKEPAAGARPNIRSRSREGPARRGKPSRGEGNKAPRSPPPGKNYYSKRDSKTSKPLAKSKKRPVITVSSDSDPGSASGSGSVSPISVQSVASLSSSSSDEADGAGSIAGSVDSSASLQFVGGARNALEEGGAAIGRKKKQKKRPKSPASSSRSPSARARSGRGEKRRIDQRKKKDHAEVNKINLRRIDRSHRHTSNTATTAKVKLSAAEQIDADHIIEQAARHLLEQKWVEAEVQTQIYVLAEQRAKEKMAAPEFAAWMRAREQEERQRQETLLAQALEAQKAAYAQEIENLKRKEEEKKRSLDQEALLKQREEELRIERVRQAQEKEVDDLLEKGREEARRRKEEKQRKKQRKLMKQGGSVSAGVGGAATSDLLATAGDGAEVGVIGSLDFLPVLGKSGGNKGAAGPAAAGAGLAASSSLAASSDHGGVHRSTSGAAISGAASSNSAGDQRSNSTVSVKISGKSLPKPPNHAVFKIFAENKAPKAAQPK